MATTHKRVDAYIGNAEPFARPILRHFRTLVRRACPDAAETIKWGFPHFEHHGILCSMASFKRHCAFSFWKASLLDDPSGAFRASDKAMGHLGRVTAKNDLPSDAVLLRLIRQAAGLNERGVRRPLPRRSRPAPPPPAPADLIRALRRNPEASRRFRELPPSRRRDYIEWILGARRAETRENRIRMTISRIAGGSMRGGKVERRKKSPKS